MADACLLYPDANELVSAETFLDEVQRSGRFAISRSGSRPQFFGYCQDCRNKVIHGHFTRDGRVSQFFRHDSNLYDLAGLQRLEACGFYDPEKGRNAKPSNVPEELCRAVQADLRRLGYGVWRLINSHVLRDVGKMRCDAFIRIAQEILARPAVIAGQGFCTARLPYYALSQIRVGFGTLPRSDVLSRDSPVWLNGPKVPKSGWDYVHFSILQEMRRKRLYEIRFVSERDKGRPDVVDTAGVPMDDLTKAAEDRQHEADWWLRMRDKEFCERFNRDPESPRLYDTLRSYRAAARRIADALAG